MNDASKAVEPSADRLIEMAEHHGMDCSRHATMLDFARAVWRMGRDSALSASSWASEAIDLTDDEVKQIMRASWAMSPAELVRAGFKRGIESSVPAEAVRQPSRPASPERKEPPHE